MVDPYLYDDVPVLKNKLDIKSEQTLDQIEAEQSRANMMLLYEQGFQDFSATGLCEIHRFLFGDLYDWAGQYRIINIEKRERVLAGLSVWYSNDDTIAKDLRTAFRQLGEANWINISREQFVHQLATLVPPIWRVHPFREGNTRTVVMMMTFFCGASWILYGSGALGSMLWICSRCFCDGFAGSVRRVSAFRENPIGRCVQCANFLS